MTSQKKDDTTDTISRQAAIKLFKDDIAAVNELNNLPPLPDQMKYVQESVNIIMNTCKSDSIKDKAFRNAARMIQNAIDGEAPDFETIEALPPVDAVPVRHGRWIMAEGELAFWDECSECGKKILHRTPYYDFCPNCGANMRKDDEQHD